LSPIVGRMVQVSFDGGRLTSDAGGLVLAEIERRLGIAERLARCLADPRAPERAHHTLIEMIRFRVVLIAAGYARAAAAIYGLDRFEDRHWRHMEKAVERDDDEPASARPPSMRPPARQVIHSGYMAGRSERYCGRAEAKL
jgi:hypothetical protein